MRLATGRPVGPIIAVNGSIDALCGHYVLFMVSLIKNYFSLFLPKNVKNRITPMGTLNSYHHGIVEDTYKLFAPNRGFSGSVNFMVSFKLTPDQ